jgi:hypothetical protein
VKKLAKIFPQALGKLAKDSFVGLFLPIEGIGLWDLVIYVPGMRSDHWKDMRFIGNLLMQGLRPKELVQLSKFVILEDPQPWNFLRGADVPHEMVDFTFNGIPMSRGFIFAEPQIPAAKPAKPARSR